MLSFVIPNDTLTTVFYRLGNPYFLSALGSRMLFNLKEAGNRAPNEGTNYLPKTMREMELDRSEGKKRYLFI